MLRVSGIVRNILKVSGTEEGMLRVSGTEKNMLRVLGTEEGILKVLETGEDLLFEFYQRMWGCNDVATSACLKVLVLSLVNCFCKQH